jgi:type I site-specific restriction endonuclease
MQQLFEQENLLNTIRGSLSNISEKTNSVTTAINEMTNQIKWLISLVSQPPLRQDIVNKINDVNDSIDDLVDDKVLHNLTSNHKELVDLSRTFSDKIITKLDDRERDHAAIKNEMNILISKLETVLSKQDLVCKDIKEQQQTVSTTVNEISKKMDLMKKIVLWFLFTGVPAIFALSSYVLPYVNKPIG